MYDGKCADVCDDAWDDRASQRAVRGAIEPGRMRILPERDHDDMSRIPRGDRDTDPESRKDSDDGSDLVVRHERRRDSGDDRGIGERDASKLQPGESDHTCVSIVPANVIVRI